MSGLIPTFGYIPGEMPAPSGTRLAFNQAAAPLGWVIDTSAPLADCHPRTVTDGSGGTNGGSAGFSGWYGGGTFGTANFTLSNAQMPTHNHAMTSSHGHLAGDGRDFLEFVGSGGAVINSGGAASSVQAIGSSNASAANVTLQNNGSGTAVTGPNFTTPTLKYTDLIIAQKS